MVVMKSFSQFKRKLVPLFLLLLFAHTSIYAAKIPKATTNNLPWHNHHPVAIYVASLVAVPVAIYVASDRFEQRTIVDRNGIERVYSKIKTRTVRSLNDL